MRSPVDNSFSAWVWLSGKIADTRGKGPARRLLEARILLKADFSERGPGWSDSKIIAALDTSKQLDDQFHETTQLHLGLTIHGMRGRFKHPI